MTRLDVDSTWKKATVTGGQLKQYDSSRQYGGHVVCLVGYTEDYFIAWNSWGEKWGDTGFEYASNEYAKAAFQESYGVAL